MSQPKVLILHANGTNRDHDAAQAFERAGARAEIVHLNQLRAGDKLWSDYQIMCIPGGFSYADALGAGKLFALDLNTHFADEVRAFVDSGKPVIGICNGFQALVKSGILPDMQSAGSSQLSVVSRQQSAVRNQQSHRDASQSAVSGQRSAINRAATLTFNAVGHFECRWVTLRPQSQTCVWTRGLTDLIECPVAHGEGNFMLEDANDLATLIERDQVALIYTHADGTPANGDYPANPNGSIGDIAGVCNSQGNVLGLMPHPENHIVAYQHPRWARGECGRLGLALFENGVRYAQAI